MTESTNKPQRLRLTKDVDISKALPDCEKCGGKGVVRTASMDDPGEPGREIVVPVVCGCVKKNGGVKEDELDRFVSSDLEGGNFVQTMSDDIMRLSPSSRHVTIGTLEKLAKDKKRDAVSRARSIAVLKNVCKRIRKESTYGHA